MGPRQFAGLDFGRYKQPTPVQNQQRLLIHQRINVNAKRAADNEPIAQRLTDTQSHKRWKNFIRLQLWLFKNSSAFFTRWRKIK